MGKECKTLSPYIGGVFIGVLQLASFLTVGKLLGLSSSYGSISVHVLNFFYNISTFPHIEKLLAGVGSWQLSLAMGIVLGTYFSAKSKRTYSMDPYWSDLGLQKKTVYMNSFMGGFLLVFGARLAGGCTSGHGLSGIATLSAGSFVVLLAMFITAILGFYVLRKILGAIR